jgi:hypothetical protein
MAVEQSGAQAAPDPDQPVHSAEAPAPAGPPSGAEPDFDELKRKFREALDRKRDRARPARTHRRPGIAP